MDYYIQINHEKIPVTEAVYKTWCRGRRKERYFQESDIANGVFSYDALDTCDYNGQDMFSDSRQPSTDTEAENRILLEHLPAAIGTLTSEEKHLILRLYAYQDSLRKIASDEKIPLSTLQYRHQKALKKLRVSFEHASLYSDQ